MPSPLQNSPLFASHFLSQWMQTNKKENFFMREFMMCFQGSGTAYHHIYLWSSTLFYLGHLPGFLLSSVFTTFSQFNLDSGVSRIMGFPSQHTNCADHHRLVA